MKISNLVAELEKSGWVRPQDWNIYLVVSSSDLFGPDMPDAVTASINERVIRFTIPPSLNLTTSESRSEYGIARTVGTERNRGGEVSITFRVDNKLDIVKYFYYWMNGVVTDKSKDPTINYYSNYARDNSIEYFNIKSKKSIVLSEVYPISMTDMQATHEPNNSIVTIDVNFVYRYVYYKN